MTEFRRWFVIVPGVVLAGLLVWLYVQRGTMEDLAFLRKGAAGGQTTLVDQRPYQTAQTLAGMAVSAEEQAFAQQALRLADHDVDQAFALALRMAALQTRTLTGDAGRLQARVTDLKAIVKDDQARVDALTAAAKSSGVAAADGDDLDVAKAQLGLDTDELTDAAADLARESGDPRGEIQQELTAREAAQKKSDSEKKEPAVLAAKRYATLWGRADAWLNQRTRVGLIQQAGAQAEAERKTLAAQHDALEKKIGAPGESVAAGVDQGQDRRVMVATMKKMSAQRVVMGILDDRVQTDAQLATVYAAWEKQVWVQHRIVGYLVLESLAWVALIVLVAAVLGMLAKLVLHRVGTDARRSRTLETILMLGVQLVALIGVLLVIFGVPEHTPTILGLATAGLTVVFQDFILAFFGWFVLMGRNGIRVCDWVEIDGVGGEVAEIGLFKTTLLETGNWTSRGHPTGRRVSFTNSYAIRGRYFNFSTHGQWMWDEIKLNVPATANAYDLIKRMQDVVKDKTTNDTAEAEREWQGATKQNGLSRFSAEPTVELRPANSGVDVLVRFVVKANDRFEMRHTLYVALLELMEGTERPAVEAQEPKQIPAG